jgi:RNA polymerase sigma factor (sigma-70 family)
MLGTALKLLPDGVLCTLLNEQPRASDCLFERHITPLSSYLDAQFSGIDCEVVAQEALLRCLTIARLQGVTHFRSYAYKVAVRLAIKVRTRIAARGETSLSALEPDAVNSTALVSCNTDRETIETIWIQQANSVFKDAIGDLTPKCRNACLRFYIDGASIREISMQYGVTTGAIKDRLDEGRKKMRRHPRVVAFFQENGAEAVR